MEDFQIVLVVGFILIVMVLCFVLVIYKKKHQRSKEADSELRTYVDDNESIH